MGADGSSSLQDHSILTVYESKYSTNEVFIITFKKSLTANIYIMYTSLSLMNRRKIAPLLCLILTLYGFPATGIAQQVANQNFTDESIGAGVCGFNLDYLNPNNSLSTPTNAPIVPINPNSLVHCGRFDLYFEDVDANNGTGNGVGFDAPAGLGLLRRNTACDVWNYIQFVFDIPVGNGDAIEIIFENSVTNNLPIDILAVAGPYFPQAFTNGTPGFYAGNVHTAMTSGNDFDTNPEGFISVNFSNPPGGWNSDGTSAPNCQFDLFSVLLHESTHCMGFFSMLTEDANQIPQSQLFPNQQFSFLDRDFLFHGALPGTLDKIVLPNLTINPLAGPGWLRDGLSWLENIQPPYNHGIYSEAPQGPYPAGRNMSHFNLFISDYASRGYISPQYSPLYSMGPFFSPGALRRGYTTQDLAVLSQFGYQYTTGFLTSNSLDPLSSHTNLQILTNHVPYTTKSIVDNVANWNYPDDAPTVVDFNRTTCDPPLQIDLGADPNIVDDEGDPITIWDGSLFNIRGCGNGNNHNQLTVVPGGGTNGSDLIIFTPRPGFFGRAQFGFHLYDGHQRGSFYTYTIDVAKNSTCFPACSNLILNGDFEQGIEVASTTNLTAPNAFFYSGLYGRYYRGGHLSDNNPYSYYNYGVNIADAHGCTPRGFYWGWQLLAANGSFGYPVAPAPNGGDRYLNFGGQYNYFTLCDQAQTCHTYTLEFDINFEHELTYTWVTGTQVTINANFITTPVGQPNIPAVHQTVPILINVPAMIPNSGWIHVVQTFNYCSPVSSDFMQLELSQQGKEAYIDNVSLLETTPLPLVANAGPDQTICPGTPTTLLGSATGIMCTPSYSWVPAANVICPTCSTTVTSVLNAATTFTLTVNDGCRTSSDQVTINMLPTPTITATSSTTTICSGDPVTLTGSGAQSYVWNPGNISGNPVTVNPTANTTYTVTGTAANGCTSTATVLINVLQNCCQAPVQLGTNLTNATVGTGSYALNQNLTTNGNVIIAGADIKIYSGISITVQSGTLTITNSGASFSHLYACQDVWAGITVMPGCTLRIVNNTMIEDAVYATRSIAGGAVIIRDAIFNKNFYSFDASIYQNTVHPFSVERSVFTCRMIPPGLTAAVVISTLSTYLPATMIGSYSALRSYTGINATDVLQLNVGAAVTAAQNYFDNMDHGITVSGTSLNVTNNVFQNMKGTFMVSAIAPGVAISAKNPNFNALNPNSFISISIGGAAANQPNTFNDCFAAVDIEDYVNTSILNNSISSTTTVIFPNSTTNLNGAYGVQIRTHYSTMMDVVNNTITNQSTGIHVILSPSSPILLNYQTINLNSNNVTAGSTNATIMQTGILAESIKSVRFGTNQYLNIQFNTVLQANTCIRMRNIIGAGRIQFNPDLFIRPAPGNTISTNRAGIRVENCQVTLVTDNPNIRSTGTNFSLALHKNIRGIYTSNSPQTTVTCNKIFTTGQSIVFEGPCLVSKFFGNTMQNAYDGFVMLNNAVIGQQGDNTHPTDNRWTGAFSHFKTFTDNTNGSNIHSPLYVRTNVGPYYPNTNGTTQPAGNEYTPFVVSSSYLGYVCPAIPNDPNGPNPNLNFTRAQIANDQFSYSTYHSEARFGAKSKLFAELNSDPAIMSGDTSLTNFFQNNQNSTIGLFNDVNESVASGNISAAIVANGFVYPTIIPESNQQQVNSIVLSTVLVGDTLSAADLNSLTVIANMCPQVGGDAVWEARAILNWVLHDDVQYSEECQSANRIQQVTESGTSSYSSAIFPNPNGGDFTITYDASEYSQVTLHIIDVSGRSVQTLNLDPTLQVMSIRLDELADGTYMYKLIGDDAIVDFGTLIINN